MAIQERVTLKIDIDTNTAELGKLTAQLKTLERATNSNSRAFNNMGRDIDKVDRKMSRMGRTFRTVGRAAFKFIGILTKFSFIAYAGQVAILTTALLGAKLAMATGRVAAQGYSIALKGVASAATAAATAVAIAAASMRQFQEAQLSPFTGGVSGAATRNRGLSPLMRGLMGTEATQQALRGMAKSGVGVGQQNAVLRELFNISGGDSKQVASLVGSISGDPGTFKEAVGKSAGGAAAAGRAGDLQGQQLIQLLASGGLTSGTNFANLDAVMGQTVIGTLKTEMQSLLTVLSNAGEGLLGPTRDTIRLLSGTLANFTQRSMPLIMKFGDMVLGSDGLASGMQKMSNSLFRLMKNTLPTLEGFMERMSDMSRATRMFFRDMGNAMRPLESGAEVLMSMFGGIFGGMTGNGVLDRFNRTLTDNAASFNAFGDSIGNVFRAFFAGSGGGNSMVSVVDQMSDVFNKFATDVVPPLKDLASTIKDIVLNGLPPILSMVSSVLTTITMVIDSIRGLVTSIPGVGGGGTASQFMDAALLMSFMGGRGAMRRRRMPGGAAGNPGMLAGAGGFLARGGGRMQNFLTAPHLMMSGGQVVSKSILKQGPAKSALGRFGQKALMSRAGGMLMGGALLGGGAMLGMNALSEAQSGEAGTGTFLKGAGAGAMIGTFMAPGLGTAIGAGVGMLATGIVDKFAKSRRRKNLENLMETEFNENAIADSDMLARFNHTLENFEEVAKNADVSAEDLKDELDAMKPAMDLLHERIEAKVTPRIETLTEVFGYAADEAEQLARNLNEIQFANLMADEFNKFATDMTAGVGFAARFETTSANKSLLKNEQAGLEAALNAEFGGDLDKAAQTEQGRRLLESFFNNIVTQSMLVENQTGIGAEMTAINAFEQIFGKSEFVDELVAGNEKILTEDQRMANLLESSDGSLKQIALIMQAAFGGAAEKELRDYFGAQFDEKYGKNFMGGYMGYSYAREQFVRQNVNVGMSQLLTVQNPINVDVSASGVITPGVVTLIAQKTREIMGMTATTLAETAADAVTSTEVAEDAVLGVDYYINPDGSITFNYGDDNVNSVMN